MSLKGLQGRVNIKLICHIKPSSVANILSLKSRISHLTEIRDRRFILLLRATTCYGSRADRFELTVKEFEIFSLLILNPKRVFTYEMLMDLVWQEDYTYYSRKAVNNHVSNLRRKLKIAPDLPDYVKSVYGIGYKFEDKIER